MAFGLYNIACLVWLAFRLFEFSIPVWAVLTLP